MAKKKAKKKTGGATVLIDKETGEKLYVPLDDILDLTETDLSLFFEKLHKFLKWESYLMFFKQEGIPQIMIKALPEQIREMLVPQLINHPDLLEIFTEVVTEALEIIKEKGTKETNLI